MAFQPGQSGNPNGRPKKEAALSNLMREMLEELEEVRDKDGNPTGKMAKRKLIFLKACFEHAAKGDAAFAKMIMSYIDGLPKQAIDLTSDDKPLGYVVVPAKANTQAEDEEETADPA